MVSRVWGFVLGVCLEADLDQGLDHLSRGQSWGHVVYRTWCLCVCSRAEPQEECVRDTEGRV